MGSEEKMPLDEGRGDRCSSPPLSSPATDLCEFELYGLAFETRESIPQSSRFPGSSDEAPILLKTSVGPLTPVVSVPASEEANENSSLVFSHPGAPWVRASNGRVVEAEARDSRFAEDDYWYTVLSVGAGLAGLQRGDYALHASAVVIGGACIAVAGAPGSGKSTVAAAVCAAGGELVTEDLSLIRRRGASWTVGRGPGQVRLLPDALAQLQLNPADCRSRHHKRFVQLASPSVAPPLSRVYFLQQGGAGGECRIRVLTPLEAMRRLLENHRFCIDFSSVPKGARNRTFRIVAELANELEFFEVVRGPGVQHLGAVCGTIERHVAKGAAK